MDSTQQHHHPMLAATNDLTHTNLLEPSSSPIVIGQQLTVVKSANKQQTLSADFFEFDNNNSLNSTTTTTTVNYFNSVNGTNCERSETNNDFNISQHATTKYDQHTEQFTDLNYNDNSTSSIGTVGNYKGNKNITVPTYNSCYRSTSATAVAANSSTSIDLTAMNSFNSSQYYDNNSGGGGTCIQPSTTSPPPQTQQSNAFGINYQLSSANYNKRGLTDNDFIYPQQNNGAINYHSSNVNYNGQQLNTSNKQISYDSYPNVAGPLVGQKTGTSIYPSYNTYNDNAITEYQLNSGINTKNSYPQQHHDFIHHGQSVPNDNKIASQPTTQDTINPFYSGHLNDQTTTTNYQQSLQYNKPQIEQHCGDKLNQMSIKCGSYPHPPGHGNITSQTHLPSSLQNQPQLVPSNNKNLSMNKFYHRNGQPHIGNIKSQMHHLTNQPIHHYGNVTATPGGNNIIYQRTNPYYNQFNGGVELNNKLNQHLQHGQQHHMNESGGHVPFYYPKQTDEHTSQLYGQQQHHHQTELSGKRKLKTTSPIDNYGHQHKIFPNQISAISHTNHNLNQDSSLYGNNSLPMMNQLSQYRGTNDSNYQIRQHPGMHNRSTIGHRSSSSYGQQVQPSTNGTIEYNNRFDCNNIYGVNIPPPHHNAMNSKSVVKYANPSYDYMRSSNTTNWDYQHSTSKHKLSTNAKIHHQQMQQPYHKGQYSNSVIISPNNNLNDVQFISYNETDKNLKAINLRDYLASWSEDKDDNQQNHLNDKQFNKSISNEKLDLKISGNLNGIDINSKDIIVLESIDLPPNEVTTKYNHLPVISHINSEKEQKVIPDMYKDEIIDNLIKTELNEDIKPFNQINDDNNNNNDNKHVTDILLNQSDGDLNVSSKNQLNTINLCSNLFNKIYKHVNNFSVQTNTKNTCDQFLPDCDNVNDIDLMKPSKLISSSKCYRFFFKKRENCWHHRPVYKKFLYNSRIRWQKYLKTVNGDGVKNNINGDKVTKVKRIRRNGVFIKRQFLIKHCLKISKKLLKQQHKICDTRNMNDHQIQLSNNNITNSGIENENLSDLKNTSIQSLQSLCLNAINSTEYRTYYLCAMMPTLPIIIDNKITTLKSEKQRPIMNYDEKKFFKNRRRKFDTTITIPNLSTLCLSALDQLQVTITDNNSNVAFIFNMDFMKQLININRSYKFN